MSYWNAKYKNDYGEYEITFASKQKEETKAVEKLCQAIIDKRVKSADGIIIVRHGRWIDHGVRDWRCSECGEKVKKVRNVDGYCYDDKPNFCPNCGCKMQGVE